MPKRKKKQEEKENQEVVPYETDKLGRRKGGRPPKKIVDCIDIDKLPTQFQTAEELRGYILAQTNGGRDILDKLIGDFKSHKTTKAVRRDIGKMLLEMLTPQKGQNIEIGMASPDGKFVFKWMNE